MKSQVKANLYHLNLSDDTNEKVKQISILKNVSIDEILEAAITSYAEKTLYQIEKRMLKQMSSAIAEKRRADEALKLTQAISDYNQNIKPLLRQKKQRGDE